MHVLVARGVKSEAELPFAALHQLIRPSLGLDRRAPARRRPSALRSALGLGDRTPGAQERFLIYSACLSLLSELAEERPVLALIDDAHWLDAASAEAFLFVARRLDSEGIALLLAAREGELPTGGGGGRADAGGRGSRRRSRGGRARRRGRERGARSALAARCSQTRGNPLALSSSRRR